MSLEKIGMSAIFIVILAILSMFCSHQVGEPYAAIYYLFGSLSKTVDGSGLNFYFRFTTSTSLVLTAPQTDIVTDVYCGTKDG